MIETFAPDWFDPRMPDRSRCVLACLLQSAAEECPDRVFAVFSDQSQWSYGELYRRVKKRAAGLQKLGLKREDRILVWLPNGPEIVLTWFAANLLGACFVPINTAYRGQLLAHVIANSGARLMVAHAELVERLAGLDTAQLTTLMPIRAAGPIGLEGLDIRPEGELDNGEDDPVVNDDLMPWDLQSIIYTSGTTGPSKGVLSSYFHQYTIATIIHGHMRETDRIFVNGPLFHVGGTGAVTAALIYRGSVALVEGFKAAEFWQQIRDTGSTMTSGLLGSMAPYLAKTASSSDRLDNPLRRTHFYPVSETTIELAHEFGFEYFSGYGMTELPLVLMTDVNSTVKGSCGKPRAGVECRLVDEHDREVATGEIGELVVRTGHTWSFAHGYNGMPEASAQAWRNGWFHCGDLLRQDEAGNFYFVDRKKDAIRRRGENISSQEVEDAVYESPDVQEVAAFGVSSSSGEDEVMVVVVPRQGSTIVPDQLLEFLRPRMAHFMLPRYIRIVPSLPKTPTDKVRKNLVREEGVTSDTWDRQAAGVTVKRETLE